VSSQVCVTGVCKCPGLLVLCNGACIDTSADNLNCGGCNKVCASGQTCANGACTAPVTCQSNFNPSATAGCSLFPFEPLACGTDGTAKVVATFTDPILAGGRIDKTFTMAPGDRLEVTGLITCTSRSGSAVSVSVLNAQGGDLRTVNAAVYPPNGSVLNVIVPGSVDACAQPVTVRLTASVSDATPDLTVRLVPRAGANSGGTLGAPTALKTISGTTRVCDQICGNSNTSGCIDKQYFTMTVPAKKAVDVEWIAAWPTNGGTLNVEALDAQGARLCMLVNGFGFGSGHGTARLVNNLGAPQLVRLGVYSGNGALNNFNIAITTEQ
jgi:hypothetical protein